MHSSHCTPKTCLCSSSTCLCYQCNPTACLFHINLHSWCLSCFREHEQSHVQREHAYSLHLCSCLPYSRCLIHFHSQKEKSKGRGSYPSFFHKVCNHDDDSCVLFPDHPPEIFKCRLQRPLGGNVGFRFVVTLQRWHSTKRDERGITEDQLIIQVPSKWNWPYLEWHFRVVVKYTHPPLPQASISRNKLKSFSDLHRRNLRWCSRCA